MGANLILGGIDANGKHIVEVDSSGFVIKAPYSTMGSGSLHAGAVLELGYKDDLSLEEGLDLCARAIEAGIKHDMGSGSTVNAMAVDAKGVTTFKDYRVIGKRPIEPINWDFRENNVEFLQTITYKRSKPVRKAEVVVNNEDAMDIEN